MAKDNTSRTTDHSLGTPPGPHDEETTAVLSRFFDILFPVAIFLGGITLIVSLHRSLQYGWHATATLHGVMYLFSMLVLLFRHRLSVHVMLGLFLGLMALSVVHSLCTLGLAGEGMMTLTLLCIFSGVFFGIKAGLMAVLAGIIGISLIGTGICAGTIAMRPDILGFLHAPATWLVYAGLFLLFVIPLILIINYMHKRTADAIDEAKEANNLLQAEVSTRICVENKLRESESRYRSIVENSLVAFSIVQDNRFRFVNARFCTMTGYSYDELVDKLGPLDITHQDYFEKVAENLHNRSNGETGLDEYEVDIIRKDGTQITVMVMGCSFTYNKKPAVFGTLIDITNEKLLESKLRQSQKMEAVGTLAGGIAHDFNNILTALMGFGSMLHMNLEDSNPLKRYAAHILSASEKAAGLTQSLLTFSRLQPVALKPVNLNAVIKDTESLLRRLITEDISFASDLSRESIVIFADATQMNQILFNLVANARDAMPGGGDLKISTTVVTLDETFIRRNGFGEKGRYCRLSVSDNGTGMDETTIQKIFDPFFTTKAIGKGTGLGLSTVYGIAKQHRGYVIVDSTLDQGTDFHVFFPIIEDEATENIDTNLCVREGNETILVAEDDTEIRSFIRDILNHYGYHVIEAVDGEEALKKFRNHGEISLVILDSIMPKLNGGEVHHFLKTLRPGVRTLFMSGYTKDIVVSKGIIDHSIDFISKPLYPEEFMAKVGEILDRKEG